MTYIFGWSTGDFYRVDSARNHDHELEKYFVSPTTSTLEIMFHDKNNLVCEISENILKNNFQYCSIHTPAYAYQHDEMSYKILDFIDTLCKTLPIHNIVLHPDTVVDWSVFLKYKHLPISIENMDDRKKSHKSVEDLQKVFDAYPHFKFILDLQHCFVNDPSMQLAKDFHQAFGDRLVEYHISGYDPKLLHYPLFKTKQDGIIKAVERKDLPMIIESTFDEADWLQREIEYIESILR